MSKSIYELDLHEDIEVEDGRLWVRRVPSGWIYVEEIGRELYSTFVPYDNRFYKTPKERREEE